MAAQMDMALDDIIKTEKGGERRSGRGGARSGGGGGKVTRSARSDRRNKTPYSRTSTRTSGGRGGSGGGGVSVFVGNLDWSVEWQDLKDYMCEVGRVEFCDVLKRNDGKSSGGGLVRYANPKDARRAIKELTDTKLKGRLIFVREDRESGNNSGGRGNSHAGGYRSTNASSSGRGGAGSGGGSSRLQSGGENTVFVGNLDWSVQWQDLKDHMAEVGTIEYADVLTRNDGKSSGGGLVRYSTKQEAQRAIKELTDTTLKGRLIFVREDRESGNGGKGGTGRDEVSVYVGNIPFHTQWQTLKDLFSDFGATHADCGEPRNGRMRGFGLVKFESLRDAEAAIKAMDGHRLEGREIEVRLDNK